jgi:hypothetical protein
MAENSQKQASTVDWSKILDTGQDTLGSGIKAPGKNVQS